MSFSHAVRSRVSSVFWRMIKTASFPAILFLHETGSAEDSLSSALDGRIGGEHFPDLFPGFRRPFEEAAE